MKKVITIIAVASLFALASCNNAPKTESTEDVAIETTEAVDATETTPEEVVETPTEEVAEPAK